MSQLQENQLFANRYRLVKKLGSGAFSEVWKAEDTKAGNLVVAIKIYAPDKGMDEDGIAIFSQEYALVFNVTHQNLLRPNYFDNNNGSPFLVLPYCSKGSVLKMLGSNPSEQELVMLLRDVASGLAYLHKQNPPIIHQDIKPDNILITESGEYKLTDFGISTRIRSTLRRSVGNTSNAGTMAYMAPERFERNPAPIMASDIWSLGATLFELMTDDAPFGNLGGVSLKSGAEIPEVGGNYSNEFKQLVEACLAKDPWDRPTAEQLAKYADKVLNGENPKAPWQREVQEHPSSSQDLGRPTQRITSSPPQENDFGRTTQQKSEQEQKAQEPKQQTIVANKKSEMTLIMWVALGVVFVGLILFLQGDVALFGFGVMVVGGLILLFNARGQDNAKKVDIPADDIPMVFVEGGTFTMGCTSEQSDRDDDESPTHPVTLSGFYIGKYEVTQAQWNAVMSSNPSNYKGDNLPVENLSWNEVKDFIEKLNAKTGKHYRLPTEAEWEFAARGGNKSSGTMYAGSNNIDDVGWYRGNSGSKTHPVGQKTPNELDVYDMSGNVWEWCSDWYGNYSSSSQTDPKGPSSGSARVLRGGSWISSAKICRVSHRDSYTPGIRSHTAGFRLALVP